MSGVLNGVEFSDLPVSCDTSGLKAWCEGCGDIVHFQANSGKATVEFRDVEASKKAQVVMNQRQYAGKKLQAKLVKGTIPIPDEPPAKKQKTSEVAEGKENKPKKEKKEKKKKSKE
eukprot:NODE_2433_length_541_cov_75.195122_g1931_i0.p2 GENE.NODE_2433_length_541_cov_75.195122_g1931_i0~~NODE_2433_length_541_cov_75.195122_g1931_i0.p2  ORF type:complete len:128 (+),score=54.36 NODE_2433_length_541_cov_75.195122_g1931_i0:37-384(+)